MEALFGGIPSNPTIDRFIDLSFEISEKVIRLLKEKNLTQKDLANKLHKSESEISKWLRGEHNFTLKTIAAIEVALDEKFVQVNGLEQDYFVVNNPDGQIKYILIEDVISSKSVSDKETDDSRHAGRKNRTKSSGYVLPEITSICI